MSFRVGDKVAAYGVSGVVTSVEDNGTDFPIVVAFYNSPNRSATSFTADGREFPWHFNPSLILVERSRKRKRTETRNFWLWVNKRGSMTKTYRDVHGMSPFGTNIVEAHARYGSVIRWSEYRKLEWSVMQFEVEID